MLIDRTFSRYLNDIVEFSPAITSGLTLKFIGLFLLCWTRGSWYCRVLFIVFMMCGGVPIRAMGESCCSYSPISLTLKETKAFLDL